jgi:hypothetical protein
LFCASECYEALEEWDKAEALVRALSERYPEHCYYWLYFCKRTGHGNVRAAEKLVVDFLVNQGNRLAPEDLYSFGVYYILTKQHAKALDIFLKLYQEKPSDSLGWALMVTMMS